MTLRFLLRTPSLHPVVRGRVVRSGMWLPCYLLSMFRLRILCTLGKCVCTCLSLLANRQNMSIGLLVVFTTLVNVLSPMLLMRWTAFLGLLVLGHRYLYASRVSPVASMFVPVVAMAALLLRLVITR